MSKPIVPDVSLIFDESKKFPSNKEEQPKSYKEWKQQQYLPPPPPAPPSLQQHDTFQKLIPNQMHSTDRKKIVTFDLPIEMQSAQNATAQPVQSTPMALCQQLDLSLYETAKNNQIRHSPVGVQSKQQLDYNALVQRQHENRAIVPEPSNQNFEEFYKRLPMPQSVNQMPQPINQMSNQMRNHTSDNSKEIILDEIYRLLQDMQLNKQTTVAMPSKQNDLNRMQMQMQNPTLGNYQSDHQHLMPNHFPALVPHTASSEPSMKDLFNLILRQQEQLLNVQNQVQVLLMRSVNTPPSNQIEPNNFNNNNQIMDTNALCNGNQTDPHTKQVGVMTSLEINVQNYKPNATQSDENFNTPVTKKSSTKSQNNRECGCACNCNSSKKSPSSDSTSNDDNYDTSPRQDEVSSPGWTFYGNILNQVNDVLQNTSPVTAAKENQPMLAANIENRFGATHDIPYRRQSNAMPNIRTAQFKQVGFQIDDVNISAMAKR